LEIGIGSWAWALLVWELPLYFGPSLLFSWNFNVFLKYYKYNFYQWVLLSMYERSECKQSALFKGINGKFSFRKDFINFLGDLF
jgi:hypothetical protein